MLCPVPPSPLVLSGPTPAQAVPAPERVIPNARGLLGGTGLRAARAEGGDGQAAGRDAGEVRRGLDAAR